MRFAGANVYVIIIGGIALATAVAWRAIMFSH